MVAQGTCFFELIQGIFPLDFLEDFDPRDPCKLVLQGGLVDLFYEA